MAAGSSGQNKSARDKMRAAALKRDGVERTTGRCSNCYRIITCESRKSKNTHIGLCR